MDRNSKDGRAGLLEGARRQHKAGRIEDAEAVYKQILESDPDDAEALHLLGVAAHQRGRHEEAVDLISRAIGAGPGDARYHNNLGAAHMALGQSAQALAGFRKAAHIDPEDGDTHANLGAAYMAEGEYDDALACYGRALEINPDDAGVHFGSSEVLRYLRRFEEAIDGYGRAIEIKSDYVPAHFGLGDAYEAQGRTDAAETCYRRVIELAPDFYPVLFRLASLLQDQGRSGEAIEFCRRAQDADPENSHGWFALAEALNQMGRDGEAITAYERVLALSPDHLRAKWRSLMTLPIVYGSEAQIEAARTRWASGLARFATDLDLEAPESIARAEDVIASSSNFGLHYQGRDDRELQSQYGALVNRIAAAAYPDFVSMPNRARGDGRIRVGFISANFHDTHTVSKLFGSWVGGLDPVDFDVHFFYLGDKPEDNIQKIKSLAEHFHDGKMANGDLARAIRDARLDALIYTDMGMSPRAQLFAALRLAPIQCATWGHPVTTGLSTMDYFLSSALMEPEDGEAHYTEKLIRLPNISISYEMPDAGRAVFPTHLGTRGSETVFLCTQSLYKLLPQFDAVFPRIVERVGDCRFWFIRTASMDATNIFRERLERTFARHGLHADHACRIYPILSQEEFLGLNRAADVVLDSMLWNGGNTTLEALACNKPVVTLPGPMMRGRHGYGILKMMGVEDTIAQDIDDYVAIAGRLATDTKWREQIAKAIGKNKHRVYNDRAAIDGLADFIKSVCG